MAQKHSQLNPHSPCFVFEPSRKTPTMPSQETAKAKNPNATANANRRQHKNKVHPPSRNNRQRNRMHHTKKNRNTQKNGSLTPLVAPKKSRPRQQHSKRSPRNPKDTPRTTPSSPKSSRQCAFIEEGPDTNDVVCYSIPFPKRPRGVVAIQPNCKHEGNLLFGAIVWNTAHRYTKAMASLSKNPTLSKSLDATSKNLQKKLAGIIAAKIISRGGRFLVWIKQDDDRIEYSNNGSWQYVGREDILNISRYALLTRVKAIEEADNTKHKNQASKATAQKALAIKKAHENDDSTATTIDTSSYYCNDSIMHILSEFGLSSDEDDLDFWLASPDTNDRKMPSEVRCWDYKLLLPSQMA